MWVSHAAGGRDGRLSWAVWVEVIVSPSGSRTLMPELTRRLLWKGASTVMKWPVAPVSEMAGVGEAGGGEETNGGAGIKFDLNL
jgi:hypothetical protein